MPPVANEVEDYVAIESLDEVLGPGVEVVFRVARKRRLTRGLVIGIWKDGHRYVRVMGADLNVGSCFEIASMTKTFTAELANILVKKGVVSWSDPIGKYLPEAFQEKLLAAPTPITLMDLALHRAGLPLLPQNIRYTDRLNPYGSYSQEDLLDYLRDYLPVSPAVGTYNYSNLGFALLGYVLECAAGVPYKELLEKEVLAPLGLNHTYLAAAGSTPGLLAQGYSYTGKPTGRWTQRSLAPAGAICSTVGDQLRWIEYLLSDKARDTFRLGDYPDHHYSSPGWTYDPRHQVYERDGMTGGFSGYLGVNVGENWGVVLLSDRKTDKLMGALAKNCESALLGRPLPGLHGDYGNKKGYLLELLRSNRITNSLARKVRARLAQA